MIRFDRPSSGDSAWMSAGSSLLTEERLFAWHASLFPTGRSGMRTIVVGRWRDDRTGPMQVVSGPAGREKVHYEAPPAERLPEEMERFLSWFENPGEIDPLLTAGLAHLWFVTIHPFDDGNGRIARAIADMVLSRSESSRRRFYSMSAQIRRERVDVTQWQMWFLDCLLRAIEGAHRTPPIATASIWSNAARCKKTLAAAAAPVTHLLGTTQTRVDRRRIPASSGFGHQLQSTYPLCKPTRSLVPEPGFEPGPAKAERILGRNERGGEAKPYRSRTTPYR